MGSSSTFTSHDDYTFTAINYNSAWLVLLVLAVGYIDGDPFAFVLLSVSSYLTFNLHLLNLKLNFYLHQSILKAVVLQHHSIIE